VSATSQNDQHILICVTCSWVLQLAVAVQAAHSMLYWPPSHPRAPTHPPLPPSLPPSPRQALWPDSCPKLGSGRPAACGAATGCSNRPSRYKQHCCCLHTGTAALALVLLHLNAVSGCCCMCPHPLDPCTYHSGSLQTYNQAITVGRFCCTATGHQIRLSPPHLPANSCGAALLWSAPESMPTVGCSLLVSVMPCPYFFRSACYT
jgi:hypothetical protein